MNKVTSILVEEFIEDIDYRRDLSTYLLTIVPV